MKPSTPGSAPSLTHRALGGMVWTAGASGATAVLQSIVLICLTRLLSSADFGVVGAALIVIGFSLVFSQLGVGQAIVHRPVLEPRHVSTAFVTSVSFGLGFGVLVWCVAPLIAVFFRMPPLLPVVRVLAVLFPIAGLSTVAESLVQRDLRFRQLASVDVVTYGLGYGLVAIVLAAVGWGVWALVAGQITQAALRAAIMLRFAPPRIRPRPSWRCFQDLMDYGVGQSAARVAMFVANQADNLVVGRWLGAIALGYYSRAYQLMSRPTALFGDVLDKVLFPTMARVQNEPHRLAAAYLQAIAIVGLVTLPTGVVAAVLAPDLVAVVFGPRWTAIVPAFQVLAFGMMFRTSSRISDSLSRATGRLYRRAWRQALYAALVFAGALAGQPWGITGVAVGVLGALLINYLLMAHLSLSVGQVTWLQFFQVQIPSFSMAVLLGTVTLAATTMVGRLGLPPFVGLGAGVMVALGTATLMVWLVPSLALGIHGVRMRQTILTFVAARFRPSGLGEPT